jgi:hypothetical protein
VTDDTRREIDALRARLAELEQGAGPIDMNDVLRRFGRSAPATSSTPLDMSDLIRRAAGRTPRENPDAA